MVALVAVACGGPTDTEPSVSTVSTGTTVTLGIDSKWQVPSEFDVGLPLTHEQMEVMIRNDRGGQSDVPEFTMSGEVATDEGPERVLIIIYSDGVSTEARPMEVLRPWLNLVQGADLGERRDHSRRPGRLRVGFVARSSSRPGPEFAARLYSDCYH